MNAAARVLSPFMRLASKRWRAGRSLTKVAQAFPQGLHIDESNLLELIAELRADASTPPTWDFPEGRAAKASEEWICNHADGEDLPRNWETIMAQRDFKIYAREHLRAKLGSDGRPCAHEAEQNPLTGDTHCRRCCLQLTQLKISKDHNAAPTR